MDWVFSEVGEAIVLEDACLPTPSLFHFCKTLLEHYRDDERIMYISSGNFCSVAFVYPSLYEGFGILPLESMTCSTIVVPSNCSSIPEVAGDAGLLFNPRAIGDMANILLCLLDNPTERDRLITEGYQRAKAFDWDKTVAQTLDVYRAVA